MKRISVVAVIICIVSWCSDCFSSMEIIDGDTFRRGNKSFRIAGIDAPELSQPYGLEARRMLKLLLPGAKCSPTGEKSHGRTVVMCRDLAVALVFSGNAWYSSIYTSGQFERDLRRAQSIARSEKVGLWGGKPLPPWLYRKLHIGE